MLKMFLKKKTKKTYVYKITVIGHLTLYKITIWVLLVNTFYVIFSVLSARLLMGFFRWVVFMKF